MSNPAQPACETNAVAQTHATAKRVAQWMNEVKQRPVPPLGKVGTVHYVLFLPKAPARQEGEVHVFDADAVVRPRWHIGR